MKYDVLIIGAGPGGIYSATNLKEKGLKVAILEYSMPGGKVNIAPRVDNFPGYKEIRGPDLAMEFFNKMNTANVEFIPTKVLDIKKEDNEFILSTTSGEYHSTYVVVASGTDEEKLNLPGEKELLGHGLSYCAICDGHFFKDKVSAVIAEDRYAIIEAIYLAKLCKEVYVITSQKQLIGTGPLIRELESYSNVKYIYQRAVTKLIGNPLEAIELDDGSIINVDGIFPLLGYIPNTSFISDKSLLDEDDFIKVDKNYQTSIDGLFAIGDVISRELKQIYLAVNDANRLSEYLYNKWSEINK